MGWRRIALAGLAWGVCVLAGSGASADGCKAFLESEEAELSAATRRAAIERVATATVAYLERLRGDSFEATTSFHDTVFKGIDPGELDAATPIFWKSVAFGLEQAANALKVPGIVKDAVKLGLDIHSELKRAEKAAHGKRVEQWLTGLRRDLSRQQTGDRDSWIAHYEERVPDRATLVQMCRFAEIERDLGESVPSPRWEELVPPLAELELRIAVAFLNGAIQDASLGAIGYVDVDLRGFPLEETLDPRERCGGRGSLAAGMRVVVPHAPSLRQKLRDYILATTYHETRRVWISDSVEAFGTTRPEEKMADGLILTPGARDSIFDLGAVVRLRGNAVLVNGDPVVFDLPFALFLPNQETPMLSVRSITPRAHGAEVAGRVRSKPSCFRVEALR